MRSSIGGSSPPACHTTKDAIQTIALKKTIADKDKQIILLERKLATAELSIKTLQENEVKTKMTERSVRVQLSANQSAARRTSIQLMQATELASKMTARERNRLRISKLKRDELEVELNAADEVLQSVRDEYERRMRDLEDAHRAELQAVQDRFSEENKANSDALIAEYAPQLEEHRRASEYLRERVSTLHQQSSDFERLLSLKDEENAACAARTQDAEQKLGWAEEELHSATAELQAKLEKAAEVHHSDKKRLSRQSKDQAAKLEAMEEEQMTMMKANQTALRQLQAELTESITTNMLLTDSLAQARAEQEMLRESLATKDAEQKKLTEELQAKSRDSFAVESLQDKIAEVSMLHGRIEIYRRNELKMEADLFSLTHRLEEYAYAEEQLEAGYVRETTARDKEVQGLKNVVAAKSAELSHLHGIVEGLERSKVKLEFDLGLVTSRLEEYAFADRELKSAVASKENRLGNDAAELSRVVALKEEAVASQQVEVEEMRRKLVRADAALSEWAHKAEDAELAHAQELHAMAAELLRLGEEHESSLAEVKRLNASLAGAEAKRAHSAPSAVDRDIASLCGKLVERENQLETLERRVTELGRSNTAYQRTVSELEAKNASLVAASAASFIEAKRLADDSEYLSIEERLRVKTHEVKELHVKLATLTDAFEKTRGNRQIDSPIENKTMDELKSLLIRSDAELIKRASKNASLQYDVNRLNELVTHFDWRKNENAYTAVVNECNQTKHELHAAVMMLERAYQAYPELRQG